MSTADEAHAEADRRQAEQYQASLADYSEAGYELPVTEMEETFWLAGYKRGAQVTAEWLTSRKVEAAPSDTDREALIDALRNLKWVDGKQIDAFVHPSLVETAAAAILAAGFSRISQPVQVEVTDALNATKRIVDMYRHLVLDAPEDQRIHDELTALADRAIAALGGGE